MKHWFVLTLALALPWLVQAGAVVTYNVNDLLHDQILPHTTITAHQANDTVDTKTTDGALLVQTSHAIGLDSSNDPKDNTMITFSGTDAPAATIVRIMVPDAHITRAVSAEDDGTWTIALPAHLLQTGEHTAEMQVMYHGNVSETDTVAQFLVQTQDALTATSWVFLFSMAITIVCLLLAITLQLRHNMLRPAVI